MTNNMERDDVALKALERMSEVIYKHPLPRRSPLSTKMVANRWGCTSRHVVNLIKEKKLEAVRIGERKYILWLDEIERFEQCGWSGTEKDGTSTSEAEKEFPAERKIVHKQRSNSLTTGDDQQTR